MKWRRRCCVASCSWEDRLPVQENGDRQRSSWPSELREYHNCEPKKEITTQPHFGIVVSLYEKGVSHTCTHRYVQSCTNTHIWMRTQAHRRLLIFHTHTRTHMRGYAHRIHKEAQMQCTKTKQSRWAPFCVELKAFAKPVPLGRGGVHQPAQAPAWSPRVARVTLGLLPCHCLDQRGPLLSSRRWQQWS